MDSSKVLIFLNITISMEEKEYEGNLIYSFDYFLYNHNDQYYFAITYCSISGYLLQNSLLTRN